MSIYVELCKLRNSGIIKINDYMESMGYSLLDNINNYKLIYKKEKSYWIIYILESRIINIDWNNENVKYSMSEIDFRKFVENFKDSFYLGNDLTISKIDHHEILKIMEKNGFKNIFKDFKPQNDSTILFTEIWFNGKSVINTLNYENKKMTKICNYLVDTV